MTWRDAHPTIRCQARIRLKDGSFAQCGRARDESYRGNPAWRLFCRQHQEMVFKGTYRGDTYQGECSATLWAACGARIENP